MRKQSLLGVLLSLALLSGATASLAATRLPTVKVSGTPTSSSARIVVSSTAAIRAFIEYGIRQGTYPNKTATIPVAAGKAAIITLGNLPADTVIHFRARYAAGNSKTFQTLPERTLKTSAANNPNVFAIEADPHMDENSSADVFRGTLQQVLAANPSFLLDLGDIWMPDKLPNKDDVSIRARFELMKGFYSVLDGRVPLKIALGNHDGELGYSTFNTRKYRAEYFPEQTAELAYYAFTGPNSLFVVLDPFTYTTSRPSSDGWTWTLGKTQYDWLEQTLSGSTAQHKFVFIHHLLQGDSAARGGIETSIYNEWGGLNRDGTSGFAAKRPGWSMPVHQLLRKYGVDFVFKGHDHLYVHQELDGIVYQTLPQPSHPSGKVNPAQYGYAAGKAVAGSGFLKVTTSDTDIRVEFITWKGETADEYVKVAS